MAGWPTADRSARRVRYRGAAPPGLPPHRAANLTASESRAVPACERDALKAADVDDKVRQAAKTIYQALIEAELSSVIGRSMA